MKSTDDMLKSILNTLKTNFDAVSSSDRTKHKFMTLYADGISKIAQQRNLLRKDIANIGEKKLNNNLKVQALYNLTKKTEGGEEDFDIVSLHNGLSDMFKT